MIFSVRNTQLKQGISEMLILTRQLGQSLMRDNPIRNTSPIATSKPLKIKSKALQVTPAHHKKIYSLILQEKKFIALADLWQNHFGS